MPSFLTDAIQSAAEVSPLEVAFRLTMAAILGGVVAWTYRHTRNVADTAPTFPATLVLLSIVIAMVTQVIGDNVARAFSLVGALSIVRFRTVVRDTQDTAFVIFAVVVGMAVGASNLWVASIGLVVVGVSAALMRQSVPSSGGASTLDSFALTIRMATGVDLEHMLGGLLDDHLEYRLLRSMKTARQGLAIDVSYTTRLKAGRSVDELAKSLNRVEGVQDVALVREALSGP
jgi:hypothetical protein